MATAEQAPTWGVERQMNPLEALMWRAEADPQLRSTIVGVEILSEAPDWERYVAAHDWATRMVPRFRQRVVEAPLGATAPTWVVDRDFDLSYHVRRTRLSEGSYAELLAVAQTLAMTPFDKARSPWESLLVEGLPDGRAAYVLKLHHSATDGNGIVKLLGALHGRTPQSDPDKPQPLAPPPPMTRQRGCTGTSATTP